MNYNSEAVLIIYPHGTGGRFLEVLLDANPTNLEEFASQLERFKQLFLRDNFQGEIFNSSEDKDRYVFAVHDDIGIHENFLKFKNFKIITIVVTSKNNEDLLRRRRIYLNSPPLCSHETSLISTFQHRLTASACIELEDFWTPTRAIPLLKTLLTQFNIKNDNLEELYNVWYNTAIAPI